MPYADLDLCSGYAGHHFARLQRRVQTTTARHTWLLHLHPFLSSPPCTRICDRDRDEARSAPTGIEVGRICSAESSRELPAALGRARREPSGGRGGPAWRLPWVCGAGIWPKVLSSQASATNFARWRRLYTHGASFLMRPQFARRRYSARLGSASNCW